MASADGKTLTTCFSLVSACGEELCGLHDAMNNLFATQLSSDQKHSGVGKKQLEFVLTGNPIIDDRLDDSQWVYTDQAVNFLLKDRDNRKTRTERYLGYQISMSGSGIAIPGNAEPLLHIFCWSIPVNFDNQNFIEFPFGIDEEFPYEVIASRLMYWDERSQSQRDVRKWSDCEWCFSLRLTSLNSQDDLKKYAVAPAIALLKGEDICTALPDELMDGALVRYPPREILESRQRADT